MGGSERVARQHAAGKLTVRERVERLLDAGSFHETGALAGKGEYDGDGELTGFLPANVVVGQGRIDGRRAVVQADDFTVRGGAADAAIWEKMVWAERAAHELRIPLVRLVDGTGGGGSVKTLETMGFSYVPPLPGFELVVENLSRVPVVAAALGPCAGLGAARVVAQPLQRHRARQRAALRRRPARGRRGDGRVARQGGARRRAGADARRRRRQRGGRRGRRAGSAAALPRLPAGQRVGGAADRRRAATRRRGARRSCWPSSRASARQTYRMRRVLELVLDAGSVFELGARYGRSVITALARLDGRPVGVLASDPHHYAGGLTADASDKLARFVDVCDAFRLPVVNFVDQPGFVIGTEAERAGTMRRGARALAAVHQARTPWCSVLVRKVYGVAGAGHGDGSRLNLRFAWPSGDWGSLPIDGGIEAAYRRELEAADDPVALRAEIEARLNAVRSPFRTAERFSVEEIIDPRDTRPLLCDWAARAHELVALEAGHGPVARGTRP